MDADKSRLLLGLGLHYDDEAHVLLCIHDQCKFALAIGGSRVTTHLRGKHGIDPITRKGLTPILRTLTLIEPEKAIPRADGSPCHEGLRLYKGFACRYCPVRTISLPLIRRHLTEASTNKGGVEEGRCPGIPSTPTTGGLRRGRSRRGDLDSHYDLVFMQSWTSGSTRKYWVVERDGSVTRVVDDDNVREHIHGVRERQTIAASYGTQASPDQLYDNTRRCRPALTLQERRPWLERTGWDKTYGDISHRQLLRCLCSLPLPSTSSTTGRQPLSLSGADFAGTNVDLVSPSEDESRIAVVVALVDVMMERCEETASNTSRNVRCWLRSTKPTSAYPKPFLLVAHASTTKKYRAILKRCLAMILRLYRLPPSVRSRVAHGLKLTRRQYRFLQAVWCHEAWDETVEAILENVHKFSLDAASHRHQNSSARQHQPRHPPSAAEKQDAGDSSSSSHSDCDDGDISNSESDSNDGDNNQDQDDGHNSSSSSDENMHGGDSAYTAKGNSEMDCSFLPGSDSEPDSMVDDGADDTKQYPYVFEDLVDKIFGLTLAMATQETVDGRPETSVLVYFSGVLGFSPCLENFIPIRNYTSHLSAFIYILRLVFLEYSLPLRPHPSIRLERRPRLRQLERFRPIRERFLVLGSDSPYGELISLRNFGRAMATSEAPSFLLRWSDNGHIVSLDDKISISMGQFRQLPQHFIREADRLAREMMFGWNPAIDLEKIRDDIVDNKKGFSFVYHPANNLSRAHMDLSDLACKTRRCLGGLSRNGTWDWQAVFRYKRNDDALLAMILGAMDISCGQKPRSTEILSLYCVNGEYHPRSIFVYNGRIMYVTHHHKATSYARDSFRGNESERYAAPVRASHRRSPYPWSFTGKGEITTKRERRNERTTHVARRASDWRAVLVGLPEEAMLKVKTTNHRVL